MRYLLPRFAALRFIVGSVVLVAALGAAAAARAETSTEEILKALEDVKKELPPTPTPLVPTPAAVKDLGQKAAAQEEESRERERSLLWYGEAIKRSVQGTPIPVLSHQRGSSGVPFPKPEEVVLKPIPTDTPEPLVPTSTPEPTATPYQPPRRCEKNETVRDDSLPIDNKESLLYDYILISRSLVPLDPEEVFGPGVQLIPYDEPFTEGQLIRMEIYAVPCVPYRFRMTTTASYTDIGLNALKNYSAGQAGKGAINPWIEQKLFGAKNGARRIK